MSDGTINFGFDCHPSGEDPQTLCILDWGVTSPSTSGYGYVTAVTGGSSAASGGDQAVHTFR